MTDPHAHFASSEQFARFLGMDTPPCGPHELLGLAADTRAWTTQSISHALLDRLQRIDEHPQARTPEADELRVALHVAAAQLKDPMVRTRIEHASDECHESVEESLALEPDPLAAPGAVQVGQQESPAPLGMSAEVQVADDFRIAARHVLASCGGWNPQSKRLLGYLARSASVDAVVLQRALVEITNQYSSPSSDTLPNSGKMDDGQPESEPRSLNSSLSRSSYANRPLDLAPADPRTRTWMTLGTVVMLVASSALAVLLVAMLVQSAVERSSEIETHVVTLSSSQSGQLSGAPHSPDAEDKPTPRGAGSGAAAVSSGLLLEVDVPGVIRLLRSLDEDAFARAPEESVAAFGESLEHLSVIWTTASLDELATGSLAMRDAVLSATAHDPAIGVLLVNKLKSLLDPLDSSDRILDDRFMRTSAFSYGICGLLIETPIVP